MNKNMLSPLGFAFNIKKLPEFNAFVQSCTLPGISIPNIDRPTPFKKVPIYGDHIEYGELELSFKVNEDLGNYIEIFNWLTGIGFPKEFDQFAEIANGDRQIAGNGLYSDGYLMILSSNMQPLRRIDFEDLFPVGLSDLAFDSQNSSVEYLEARVSFKFTNYTFTSV